MIHDINRAKRFVWFVFYDPFILEMNLPMSEYIYLNDGLTDADTAQISIFDIGLLHGIGLYETMRSYKGKVFRLKDHLNRLFDSATALNMTISQSKEQIAVAINELIEANNLQNSGGRLRLTVTPGNFREITPDKLPKSTLIITATGLTPYPNDLYKYGMTVVISPFKQNPDDPTTGHKTINYHARLSALQQAQLKKAGEALWFTTTNRLAEGCISNVFIVLKGKLLTPPLNTPVLPGIARKVTLELAKAHTVIQAEEKELIIDDLLAASEVFITNSVMGIMPVTHIEAHKVAEAEPGPVFQKLQKLYQELTQDK